MPVWLQIMIAVGVPLLTLTASSVVAFITKYAADAKDARKQLTLAGAKVAKWLGVLAMLVLVIAPVFSKQPVTRWFVFTTAINVSALSVIFLLSLMTRMLNSMSRHQEVTNRVIDSMKAGRSSVDKASDGDGAGKA